MISLLVTLPFLDTLASSCQLVDMQGRLIFILSDLEDHQRQYCMRHLVGS